MKPLHLTFLIVLVGTPWSTLHADPWGRLFTTPVQRAQLDSGQAMPVTTDDSSGDAPQAATTQPIQVNGTLTSSRGKHTAWLNGKKATEGVRVLGAGRVQLRITSAEAPRLMKSGQLLYPESGEILEGYAASRAAPAQDAKETDTQTEVDTDPADAPM